MYLVEDISKCFSRFIQFYKICDIGGSLSCLVASVSVIYKMLAGVIKIDLIEKKTATYVTLNKPS